MLEIPRGFGESLDTSSDAVREIYEETGIIIQSGDLVSLGWLVPNSGLSSSRVAMYAAMCPEELETGPLDTAEIDSFRWVPIREVLQMAESGLIDDAFTLAAIFRATLRCLIRI